MKPDIILAILKKNISIIRDTECAGVIVGMENAALEISELSEAFKTANELIRISNLNNEPKY